MAASWRAATVGILVCGLIGLGAPATAASPGQERRESVISKILDSAEPGLTEVVVTREDSKGRPTFETIKAPTLDKARAVIDRHLGAPGVEGVSMNHTVKAHASAKKCKAKYWKMWKKKKRRCVIRPHFAALRAGIVNDPRLSQQWALDGNHFNISALTALTWKDIRPAYVAVIDSGINASHPDLAGRVDAQYNAISPGSPATDGCGHGTHVAGTIGAGFSNGYGVTGMARTAVLRAVKVLESDCAGFSSDVAEGIVWAADNAEVLNLSLGQTENESHVRSAINYALARGRVVVAASGNHDTPCPLLGPCSPTTYPAAYPGVVGVAAVDPSGQVAPFSNFGSWVDVAAPGVGVLSTCGSDFCTMSGTSMAAPHVSALAAMTISHCGTSGATVADSIQRWASHYPSKDASTGYGIVRPYNTLQCG
jgi:hypothetical protein